MDKIREEFLEKMNVDAVVKFNDLWTSIEKTGLVMEVIFTALEEMIDNADWDLVRDKPIDDYGDVEFVEED